MAYDEVIEIKNIGTFRFTMFTTNKLRRLVCRSRNVNDRYPRQLMKNVSPKQNGKTEMH